MSQSTYSLTYEGGFREGFDATAVRQRVVAVLGLSPEQEGKVFSGRDVVLRHGLSEDDALRYCARLNSIGMAVKLRLDAERPLRPMIPRDGRREPGFGAPAVTHDGADEGEARVVAFEFRGEGAEFFRIWIVNILLSIVTLGIYSAWAKVRTMRYFYGNTRLDGSTFEYLADPIRLLKGRAIAFVLLLLYTFSDQFSPLLGFATFALFMLALPWIVRQGLAFRNHNSAWRGVRFGFDGSLGDAYKAWLMWPLFGVLSLGILMPYAFAQQARYAIGNGRFGTSRFAFDGPVKRVYIIFGAAGGVMIAGVALSTIVGFALPPLSWLVLLAGYLMAFALFGAWMTNWRFNHARLDGHLFEADYDALSYAKLVFTNTLLMVLTLGLFYPWARVRTARYAAEHTRVVADGNLDAFVAARQQDQTATGAEIGDLFDVEIGL
ncbi:MAG: DUF898 domain-containing protein [Azoarcus sp.]|nr:DUF898 domain-containing protein [Azoarcus sp.]